MSAKPSPSRAELAMYFWSLPSDEAQVDRATAGAAAGLGKKSMDLLAVNGGGPSYRVIGKNAMYRKGDVIAWIEKRKSVKNSAERNLSTRRKRGEESAVAIAGAA